MKHIASLEHLVLQAQVRDADRAIAFVDGVINLLMKAQRAVDDGTPEGRARALNLLERAERLVPDEGDLDPGAHEGITLAQESISAVRRSLEQAGTP